ncbi:UrcA family protein [Asaia spathodeae]|uniref:UrcA family protein n=1 Tax=Asaia spathodeae TaxID=657016 RepID=A0ABX2P3Z3_9PROT|nr:UrcA family protein [Asaia spathodeae]GBR22429.1 hypothetical protein AA105894_3052 [Asaia spathodeae NBRC 105894]
MLALTLASWAVSPCAHAQDHGTRQMVQAGTADDQTALDLAEPAGRVSDRSPLDSEESLDQLLVTYRPEALADKAYVRLLLRRLDRAALQVCGEMDGLSMPVRLAIERSDCHRESLHRSVTAIHNPLLTQLADGTLLQLPATPTPPQEEP